MIESGIYIIASIIDNKIYIGSTIDLLKRWRVHKYYLNINKHDNHHLQRAWNKYGEENFKFYILEYTNNLIEREQYWVDFTKCYDHNIGYNIRKIVNSNSGHKHSEETINKIKASKQNISFETRVKMSLSATGRKMSEAAIIKMKKPKSEEHKRKLSEIGKLNPSCGHRNTNRWPHELGKKCKCEECMEKKRDYQRKRIWVMNN